MGLASSSVSLTESARNNHYYPVVLGAVLGLIFGLISGGGVILVCAPAKWKDRKENSKLGAIILEEIQEELKTGIGLMTVMQDAVTNPARQATSSLGMLPTKSWSGMKTIPDKIILRIIATNPSADIRIRSDCKNYFEHVCVVLMR